MRTAFLLLASFLDLDVELEFFVYGDEFVVDVVAWDGDDVAVGLSPDLPFEG